MRRRTGRDVYKRQVVTGQGAGDHGLRVAHQGTGFFTRAVEVVWTVYLQVASPRAHGKKTHGIAFAAGVGVLIAGVFQAGNAAQLVAVSYTHLDVYKRQPLRYSLGGRSRARWRA